MSTRRPSFTAKVVIGYAAAAALWIVISDYAATRLLGNPTIDWWVDVLKGLSFVAVTAALLWVLLTRELRVREAAEVASRAAADERARTLSRLQLILERMPLGCIMNDPMFRFTYWNPAAERIFGFPSAEMIGKLPYETIIPPEADAYVRAIQRRLAAGDMSAHGANPNVTKDGRIIFCEWHNTPLHDASGALIGFLSMVQEVTERLEMQQELTESAERLRLALDAGAMGSWDWDLTSGRIVWNEQHARLLGMTLAAFDGSMATFERCIHPEDRGGIRKAIERARQHGDSYRHEFRVVWPDGSEHWVAGSGRFIRDEAGQPVRMIGVIQDVTERVEHVAALSASRERLRALSQQLLEAQEAERRRIARELHDEIGQALTAVKIGIQTAQHHPGPEGLAALGECVAIVDHALQQARTLSLELRPSILDDLGLAAALRWYLDRQARRAGLAAQLTVADDRPGSDLRLPAVIETVCFRAAQEAITNVVRHAGAGRVSLALTIAPAAVSLTIADDGAGFDVAEARSRALQGRSLGLLGMQERVELAGGRVAIESERGAGTTVRVWFELPPDGRGAQEG